MTSTDAFDPGFTPAAGLLKVVDLKVGDIRTSQGIFSLLEHNYTASRKLDYQNSVLFYTLYRRGEDVNALAARFGETPDTIRRRSNEGMAILRTGETTRTVSAIRKASLGMKAIDRATLETDDVSLMIENLEMMALNEALGQFQKKDQKGSNAAHSVNKDELYPAIMEYLEAKALPVNAHEITAALPWFADGLGIERKQRKADPPADGGHLGLEAGLKKVMDDVTAIVAACDGEPYVPTDQDLIAVLQFVEFIGRLVNCPQDESVFRFIMAQLEAANA